MPIQFNFGDPVKHVNPKRLRHGRRTGIVLWTYANTVRVRWDNGKGYSTVYKHNLINTKTPTTKDRIAHKSKYGTLIVQADGNIIATTP